MKFTDRGIINLKPKDQRYIAWKDSGNGLGLRVSPKGKKTFIFMYRFKGKARMMSLGVYGDISLAMANRKHADALIELDKKNDPGAMQVEQNQAERAAETVRELVSLYIDKYAKKNKKSWKKDETILNTYVVSRWKNRKAKDITRRDIIALLDDITDSGAPIQANRTLAAVRKMFNWAISKDILDATPCTLISQPNPETPRDRNFDTGEIKAFWENLDNEEIEASDTVKLALKLILVTAQRPGEVCGMALDEIEGQWWTIPANRVKNGLTHRVWLSDMALEVVEAAKAINGGSDFVFPSPVGDKPILPASLPRVIKRNADIFKVDPFTPHDLRRTASTRMHAPPLKYPGYLVDRVLNHKEQGVTARHYNQYGYDDEKQQILDAWGRQLVSILKGKGSNVVPMKISKG